MFCATALLDPVPTGFATVLCDPIPHSLFLATATARTASRSSQSIDFDFLSINLLSSSSSSLLSRLNLVSPHKNRQSPGPSHRWQRTPCPARPRRGCIRSHHHRHPPVHLSPGRNQDCAPLLPRAYLSAHALRANFFFSSWM